MTNTNEKQEVLTYNNYKIVTNKLTNEHGEFSRSIAYLGEDPIFGTSATPHDAMNSIEKIKAKIDKAGFNKTF